jgi:hypothetical protein
MIDSLSTRVPSFRRPSTMLVSSVLVLSHLDVVMPELRLLVLDHRNLSMAVHPLVISIAILLRSITNPHHALYLCSIPEPCPHTYKPGYVRHPIKGPWFIGSFPLHRRPVLLYLASNYNNHRESGAAHIPPAHLTFSCLPLSTCGGSEII